MSGEIILNPPTTEINKFISPKAVVVYNENNNEIFRIENCNEIDKTTKSVSDSSSDSEQKSSDESIGIKSDSNINKNSDLFCEVCNVKVTSTKILQRHFEGRKHKLRENRKGKIYRCDLCDLTANSETQLNIHLNSTKHKSKILRKEYAEFTNVTSDSKGLWLLIFCMFCIFFNLLLLFKVV